MAGEDRGADHGLEQVVGEGHPPHRRQPRLQAGEESPPDGEHHKAQVSEGHRDASPGVEQATEEHGALPAPVAGEVPPDAESHRAARRRVVRPRRVSGRSDRPLPRSGLPICKAPCRSASGRRRTRGRRMAGSRGERRRPALPGAVVARASPSVGRDLGVERGRIRRPLHLDLPGYLLREAGTSRTRPRSQEHQARHREERQPGDQQRPRPPAARQIHQTTRRPRTAPGCRRPEEVGVGQSNAASQPIRR